MRILLAIGQIRRAPNALLRLMRPVALGLALLTSAAYSQTAPDAIYAATQLPEPIYWKQTLFLIPYEFGSAAEPGAAQAVWLFVSKDRGVSWQKISEAKPHVKSFNYRAEGDGEYWFAIRTLDHQRRAWPQGAYQPELRVIVDTTMPRIDWLQAHTLPNGAIDIRWQGSDVNLDATSWRIETQSEPNAPWQVVPLERAGSSDLGTGSSNLPTSLRAGPYGVPTAAGTGRTIWQPAPGERPAAIRASVSDRAGNMATYGATIQLTPPNEFADTEPLQAASASSEALTMPKFPETAVSTSDAISAPAILQPGSAPAAGWVSSSSAPLAAAPVISPATEQPWPPSVIARSPFRLSTSGALDEGDGVTAYGNPAGLGDPLATRIETMPDKAGPSVPARYAMTGELNEGAASGASAHNPGSTAYQPLAPYREAAATRLPPINERATTPVMSSARPITPEVATYGESNDSYVRSPPPDVRPKFVGSRTFALEYDLEQVGRWGVSRVELWGTRDGGQSWARYAQDDDNRSPVVVTVDEEGLYGFRIVLQSAGAVGTPPAAGDQPELWVAVDRQRPVAELTAIERGSGNMADHLILSWRADDNNLEPAPISLFYSSRPTGPWSAVATSLANTGHYAWRVERYVPAHFYLRLEARDTAGNLAAFQTRDPVEFDSPAASARLHSAEPLVPPTIGSSDAYR